MTTRSGTARGERITGGADADRLFGLGGNDLLTGLGGDDFLDGGSGRDTLIGGRGDDTYVVDNARDRITEHSGEGQDTVWASVSYTLPPDVENLLLLGSQNLAGTGNADANVLTGNAGNNTLAGGRGDDHYYVQNTGDRVVEDFASGIDTVHARVTWKLSANVENLVLEGDAPLAGTGNALDNILVGNGASNILNGGAGNDRLDGGGGADVLRGGGGNDTYVVDNAGDRVVEFADGGRDVVQAAIDYTLPDSVEELAMQGGAVAAHGNALGNLITGTTLANLLDGGAGNDTLRGGGGDDTYVFDSAGDRAVEQAGGGHDLVLAAVTVTLADQVEDLRLTGNATIDGTGNALPNRLEGNAAANHLDGGAGDDRLDGGGGADVLAGGTGNDTYIVDDMGDQVVESEPDVTLQLFKCSFDNGSGGATFINPGVSQQSAVVTHVGAWSALDAGTLLVDGLNGFDPGATRGKAVAATGFDDGNAFTFDFTLVPGTSLALSGFSFAEQGSGANRGFGPNAWTLFVNGVELAHGAATISATGLHADNVFLGGLHDTVSVTVAARGAAASTGTWRIDDFVLTGTLDSDDTVESSVSYTLAEHVENLRLVGTAAIDGRGNVAANVLTGNDAANVLDGGGGADRLSGQGGDDVLVYGEPVALYDGGTGSDTLRLDGSGIAIDLDGLAGSRMRSLERIDLRGSGANSLSLHASDVLALDGSDHALFVRGDSDDRVTSQGQGWQQDGLTDVAGVQYAGYSVGGAHLLIEQGVQVTLG